MTVPFKTEDIAYWFFRLNGCMCLVNFLVHNRRGQEGTDVDIMAVQFPFRRELGLTNEPMVDDPIFESDGKIDLIIAEVKRGRCNLNGPWTRPERKNMQRMLYALGAFPEEQIEQVSLALYKNQLYENDLYRFRLFAIGNEENWELPKTVVQLTWDRILMFIHDRFITYRRYKTQHRQWDDTGKRLFREATVAGQNEFIERIKAKLDA